MRVSKTRVSPVNVSTVLMIGVLAMSTACGSNARSGGKEQSNADQPTARPAAAKATPNPSNELPFGAVDRPKPNEIVAAGKITASGWAVDDSSVKEIRVYLDSHYWASTNLNIPRDDLRAPLPAYMHGTNLHGWSIDIDLGPSPGNHMILVQAEDDQGATRDIGSVSVSVPASK